MIETSLVPMATIDNRIPRGLVTGNRMIDDEHSALCALLEELARICPENLNMTSCSKCQELAKAACEMMLLNHLADVLYLMVSHFSSEEAYMRQAGYWRTDESMYRLHLEDHARLSLNASILAKRIGSTATENQFLELVNMLGEWIEDHIKVFDIPMVVATENLWSAG
jgi:hemerythrin-like metal-binding protein